MYPKRILLIAAAIAALLSLSCLILPKGVASIYTGVMHPLTLFLGSVFSFKVASIYQKELRKSFLFLSLFLLLYMLGNIFIFWQFLFSLIKTNMVFLVLLLQVAAYAMLIASCVYTLRVIDVKRMNRYGWMFLGLISPLCLYILYRSALSMVNALPFSPALAIVDMMITVFDMLIVLMLVPVLFLYLQYLRARAQESITFTFIIGGLILSLVSTYIFQMVEGISPDKIAEYFQKGSALDAAYIFGYLIVAIGLYAHQKYDEWGFRMIEKALR